MSVLNSLASGTNRSICVLYHSSVRGGKGLMHLASSPNFSIRNLAIQYTSAMSEIYATE